MSIAAEFARELHERENRNNSRQPVPFDYSSKLEKLTDIRAIIFDVYGTLCNYWREEFNNEASKVAALEAAFRKIVDRFKMADALSSIIPSQSCEKTLYDFYHGLIAIKHDIARKDNIEFPEIKVEEIWKAITLILMRHGYKVEALGIGEESDVARCMAFFYNFHLLGRGLYQGVVDTLIHLKQSGIMCGIVSNGQFYTPIDLTLFIRDQSNYRFEVLEELFDPNLIFFSYEYGVSKSNRLLYRKLYDALYEYNILPKQTVYVGNELAADIKAAQQIGMRTALFTGDRPSTFLLDVSDNAIPDITFKSWEELKYKVSLGEKG